MLKMQNRNWKNPEDIEMIVDSNGNMKNFTNKDEGLLSLSA
jgi:hypothetical protein